MNRLYTSCPNCNVLVSTHSKHLRRDRCSAVLYRRDNREVVKTFSRTTSVAEKNKFKKEQTKEKKKETVGRLSKMLSKVSYKSNEQEAQN